MISDPDSHERQHTIYFSFNSRVKLSCARATLKIGRLFLTCYFMQIRCDVIFYVLQIQKTGL